MWEIDGNTGCWIWLAAVDRYGYGKVKHRGRDWKAHRRVYTIFRGEIEEGMVLDHLCRNRKCVNPYHLEPVSIKENTLRGKAPSARNAKKTHCKRKHPLIEGNLVKYALKQGKRVCLTCTRERDRRRYASKKAKTQCLD